ncbi:hypothetical protein [Parasphingorhabdus halotolerans]|uniref:Lipoprotein n=1 Tax=Parasphingorhabdus halotolerans TaxID=2725558 RepID=A0A6H2DK86_9SPHN|nr:hypothetical protein [Parasphingorhabdus halotolerans]QJB68608.1 hypothetical protein HF685_04335 [Parasphingorhabdus halotolerans]
MRLALNLLATMLLFACSDPDPGAFEVEVLDGTAQGAVLTLYNVSTDMRKSDNGFVGERVTPTDGSGEILVNMRDGSLINCSIGYVTHGLSYQMKYRIEGGRCEMTQMFEDVNGSL